MKRVTDAKKKKKKLFVSKCMPCTVSQLKEKKKCREVTRLQGCSLCAFVLGLSKQSYLHFSTIMRAHPIFHSSDNILTAVSMWHSH